MSIKEFEILHGAVLVRITHNKKPVNLQLIETKEGNSAVYTINEAVELFIKRSKSPQEQKKGDAWTFSFTSKLMTELVELQKKHPVVLALVCGREEINTQEGQMYICFLDETKLPKVFDLSVDAGKSRSISVKLLDGKRTFSVSSKGERITVKLNAIDGWDIPGK